MGTFCSKGTYEVEEATEEEIINWREYKEEENNGDNENQKKSEEDEKHHKTDKTLTVLVDVHPRPKAVLEENEQKQGQGGFMEEPQPLTMEAQPGEIKVASLDDTRREYQEQESYHDTDNENKSEEEEKDKTRTVVVDVHPLPKEAPPRVLPKHLYRSRSVPEFEKVVVELQELLHMHQNLMGEKTSFLALVRSSRKNLSIPPEVLEENQSPRRTQEEGVRETWEGSQPPLMDQEAIEAASLDVSRSPQEQRGTEGMPPFPTLERHAESDQAEMDAAATCTPTSPGPAEDKPVPPKRVSKKKSRRGCFFWRK